MKTPKVWSEFIYEEDPGMKRTRRTPLFIRTYQDDESERYHKQQRRSNRDMESRTHSHTDERRRIVGEHRVVTVTNTGDEKSSGDDERRVGHSGNETRMKDRRRSTQATDLYGSHSLWLRFRRCHPHLPIVGYVLNVHFYMNICMHGLSVYMCIRIWYIVFIHNNTPAHKTIHTYA